MIFHYNIVIVRQDPRDNEDIVVVIDTNEKLDCYDGDNRRKIVDHARTRSLVKQEDVQYIRDVVNLTEAEYDELMAYNKEEAQKKSALKQKLIDHLFAAARGYGMAEGNGIQSYYDKDGNLIPDGKGGGTVAGGKLAFTKCIEAVPEEYLEHFIYTLQRITDKSGEDGFDWRYS